MLKTPWLRWLASLSGERRCVLALCVLSALLGRLCFLARPFDSDGAIFIYQGKLVSEGERYVYDFIDNKFPTVGLLTGFFWRSLGVNSISRAPESSRTPVGACRPL